MSEGFSFYAVKKDLLPSAPKGVKQFIEDFFEEKEIFGIICYVAIESSYKYPWFGYDDEEDYHKGLTKEEIDAYGVFTWFEKHPEIVFEYYWE